VAVVVANVAGALVQERTGLIASTISDVAAGRHAWIQDLGLYLFGVGILAVAFGLYRRRAVGARWRTGLALLALSGVLIFAIAAHGEYGDREPGGLVIHGHLVYALFVGFAGALLLTAPGLAEFGAEWRRFGYMAAGAWLIMAPLFYLVPTGWDGLYERLVGLISAAWVAAMAWLLIRRKETGAVRR
jgi:hypothetical protein